MSPRAARPLALLVLAALLTGCSGDPYEDYCDTVAEHQDVLTEAVAGGDPDALLSVLPELRDLRDASPGDVADEWQQVVGRLEALQEALDDAGVDPGDYDRDDPPTGVTEEQRTAIEAAGRELVRPETSQAFAVLETEVRDVCQTPLYR